MCGCLEAFSISVKVVLGTQHSHLRVLILASIILPILFAVPSAVPPAHSAGILYVSPAGQGPFPVNTMVTYQVKVASMDSFNLWDVSVETNLSVLNPLSLTIAGNLFQANFSSSVIEVANCINGVGAGCTINDGPGIVHSEAVSSALASGSGLLFTITYQVVASGYSFVTVLPGLEFIVNKGASVAHSTSNGVYGTVPSNLPVADFSVSSATPIGGDRVTFNASLSGDPNPGVKIVRYTWTIDQLAGGILLTNSTSQPIMVHHFAYPDDFSIYEVGQFGLTLVATDSLGLSSQPITLLMSVGDFVLHAAPAYLSVREVGHSEIILDGLYGFTGNVMLSVTAPSGFQTFFNKNPVTLTSTNTSSSSVLIVAVPHGAPTGVFVLTVTATIRNLTHSILVGINVTHH